MGQLPTTTTSLPGTRRGRRLALVAVKAQRQHRRMVRNRRVLVALSLVLTTVAGGMSSASAGPVAAPEFLSGPAEGAVIDGQTARFDVVNHSTNHFSCKLDLGDWSACDSTIALDNLTNGTHTLQVRGVSGRQRGDVATRSFIVKHGRQRATFTSGPVAGAVVWSGQAEFAFDSTQPGTTQCQINTGDWQNCSSPFIVTGLPAGQHTLKLRPSTESEVTDTRSFVAASVKHTEEAHTDVALSDKGRRGLGGYRWMDKWKNFTPVVGAPFNPYRGGPWYRPTPKPTPQPTTTGAPTTAPTPTKPAETPTALPEPSKPVPTSAQPEPTTPQPTSTAPTTSPSTPVQPDPTVSEPVIAPTPTSTTTQPWPWPTTTPAEPEKPSQPTTQPTPTITKPVEPTATVTSSPNPEPSKPQPTQPQPTVTTQPGQPTTQPTQTPEPTQPVVEPTTKPTPKPVIKPKPQPEPKPGGHRYGVPAGTKLAVHNGDLTITTPGTHIDGLDVRGFIRVKAPNVKITRTIVRGAKANKSIALIQTLHPGVVIEDVELNPSNPSVYIDGIKGHGFTARRVNIHRVVDTVLIHGDNSKILNSWLHDNAHFESDPHQGGKPSHDDGVQLVNGHNTVISGNRIEGADNAAVMVAQDRGGISNLKITNNYLSGGGCTINISEKGKGSISGIAVVGNKFGTARHHHCGIVSPQSTKLDVRDNTFKDDGSRVNIRKGR